MRTLILTLLTAFTPMLISAQSYETCTDAFANTVSVASCVTTTLSDVTTTTVGAMPDVSSGCPDFDTENTVWFAFTTDADAQTIDINIINGTISGTSWALIDDCTNLSAVSGCLTSGLLEGQAVSSNTTYLIAVSTESGGTNGDFTVEVTPLNRPNNDLCSSPDNFSGSIDGTTTCASPANFDFCSSISEDHAVYYTYTVDATITTNRTITITTTGNTITTGTMASAIGLAMFTDCSGTQYVGTPTSGDLCAALDAPIIFECVEPGTSFTIAVATPSGSEGDFNIMIEEMETGVADNDVCDLSTNPDITTVADGTTFCADGETTFCGMTTTADHQVWYTYTNNTGGNVDLELTFTGTGSTASATDLSMVVFESGCGSNTLFNGTTASDYCNILGGGPQIISCIEDGESISIVLGSAEDPNVSGPEGNFNISSNVIPNNVSNDECGQATDISNSIVTCEWVGISANNENACPEDFSVGSCSFNQDATVWYSFTVPSDPGTYKVSFQNIDTDTYIALFDDGIDCDNPGTVAINSQCEMGPGPFGDLYDDLSPGSTYLIALANPTEGDHSFQIKLSLLPANDECEDAISLASLTHDGTTACATAETVPFDSSVCSDEDEHSTVWYEYEVPSTDKGFHVSITSAGGAEGLQGNINVVVFESTASSCDVTSTTLVDEVCTNSGDVNEEFECVGPGTYILRISTSIDNEGDFSITITPQTIDVANDFCDAADATPFVDQLECEWMTFAANTMNACPENMNLDPSDCGIDDYPVIWYEVTAPNNAEFLDLQINSSDGSNPFIAVYSPGPDCSNLTFVTGSTCYTGEFMDLVSSGQNQIPVTGGEMYLVAVGIDDINGGNIDFGIKWITPPDNDDCDMAEVLDANMPGGSVGEFTTGPIAGTTQCATIPVTGTACDADKTNTVWYSYTVGTDVKEITLDVENWTNANSTGSQDFSITVVDGCSSLNILQQTDGSNADYCGSVGEELIKLSCLDAGSTILILVSSSAENEGTFELTLNANEPSCTYTNDDCDMAMDVDAQPIDTDEDCTIIQGCNDLACSDLNFGACAGDQLNTVFYTFTTDADADEAYVNIEILNGESGELDNPGAVLFTDCGNPLSIGNCDSGSGGEYTSGPLGGPGFIMANTTYTIMVFNSDSEQNGGTFDLCVTVSSGCVNDICDEAFTLEQNTPVDNPASTENCTPDESLAGCDATLEEATLWYQVEVPEGYNAFNITLTNDGVGEGVGDGSGEVSIAVGQLLDCNSIDASEVTYSDCSGFGTNGGVHEITCVVEFGTYYIQIGSADELDAGDFTIEYTPVMNLDPANDICSEAEDLVITEFCELVSFQGTLKEACPEINDFGACEYTNNSSVWYKITIPSGTPIVNNIDLQVEGLTNPIVSFFEYDCTESGSPSAGVVNTSNTGDGASTLCLELNTLTDNTAEGIVVTPGTEYYILVGSSTNEQLPFDLNIKLNAPPMNDDPCINSVNLPYDLTGGGSHSGTTCCARGSKDTDENGNVVDWPNQGCSQATEDAAVWYMYTPDGSEDGFDITLTGLTIGGPTTLEIYTGTPDAGCTNALTLVTASCSDNSTEIQLGNCVPDGEVYFIKVTTDDAEDACGTFDISMDPASCGNMADECVDAVDILMPDTPDEFDIIYSACVTSCLSYGCAEASAMGGCNPFTENPTVWFQVETDEDAAQMYTTVETNGNWTPVWSIWSGTSCDDLEIMNAGGTPPCSDGDNTPELHQVGVISDVSSYWIAVTAQEIPDGGIDDGSFELCIATAISAVICLGDEGGDCGDPTLVMEVTEREIDDQPLTGPFCQGEEVTVSVSFTYDASETGQDWLIGLVPIFGNGWDLSGIDYAANAPEGNGMTAVWFEEGGALAPIIQEPNPILCTFVNMDGTLQLCNETCSPCEDCTNNGLMPGDPLPSGYFWVSQGGIAGCDNDGSPGEGYGIGSNVVDITWELTLTVKEFENEDECFQNNDLSISFQTFSDGVAGCWEDQLGECILDRAMFSPPWRVECGVPPPVVGEDDEFCNGAEIDIEVMTEDGSLTQIQVDVVDNPLVDGEMSHTFEGGFGIIDDVLVNNTTDPQEVRYMIYSVDDTKPCPGVINEIVVTIYPELEVEFTPNPDYVCDGDCKDISPNVIGGKPGTYTYEWSADGSDPSLNVCPTVATTYSVTVTDELGCTGTAQVEVDVKDPVIAELPTEIDVCKDDEYTPWDPQYQVCLTFTSGSPNYNVDWVTESGLDGDPAGECFNINEETSLSYLGNNGSYTLTANITDAFGCTGQAEMIVNITGELNINITPPTVACGDTETSMDVSAFDDVGNIINTFFLYGGCPGDGTYGAYLDDAFSNNGFVTFSNIDLQAYSCFTVVVQTDSGCEASQEISIPITTGTPIQFSGTPSICAGEEATITVDNASDYTSFVWTPNIGSTGSITFSPDTTATYSLTTMDATGCAVTEIFTVTVNEEPTVGMSGTVTFCNGSSATVTASGGVDYVWNPGGATGAMYTSSTDGETVTVTVTDANGCSADSTITFTEESEITISLGDVNICDGMGDSIFIDNVFTDVEWTNTITLQTVSDTNFYVIDGPGIFEVVAIESTSGCPASGNFEVMDFSTPQLNLPDTVGVCRKDSGIDSLCIDFVAQTGGVAGAWTQVTSIPNFSFSSFPQNEVCFTDVPAGFYTFVYMTNGAQAPCENITDTMVVQVNACPCPSAATQDIGPFCNNANVDLTNAEITTDAGTWSMLSGPSTQDLVGLITAPATFNAVGVLPGTYELRFTLSNPGGGTCDQFSDITIEIQAPEVITGMDEVLCSIAGGTDPTEVDLFTLISVDATHGGTWTQIDNGSDMVTLTGSTLMSNSVSTYPQTLIWEYTGPVTNECPASTVQVEILIRDCNCPFINVKDTILCNSGGTIDLNNLLENPDAIAGSWSSTGNLIGASTYDPMGQPSGAYDVVFTLDSPIPNCPETYTGQVVVRRQPEVSIATGTQPCSTDTGNGSTTVNLYDWIAAGYSAGSWSQKSGDVLTFTDDNVTGMAIVDFNGQTIGEEFIFTYTTNTANTPCENVSVDVTIKVADCNCPPIVLDTPPNICNDAGMFDICILSMGSDPGTVAVFGVDGTDYSSNINGCMFEGANMPAGTYNVVFTLDQTVTGNCTQSLTQSFEIFNFASVSITDNIEVCSDAAGNGVTSVNFTAQITGADIGTWTNIDGVTVNLADLTNVSFVGVPNGTYAFEYLIDNAEPCEDYKEVLLITVSDDCNCPPINLGTPQDICSTDGPLDLGQYADSANPGTWSSTELTINGDDLIIDGVSAGNYTITYTLNSPLPDCPETETIIVMIGEPANAGSATDYSLCEGVNEIINLNDYLEGEDAGGVWTSSATGLSGNEFTTDGQVAGAYTFTYTISGTAPCPEVSSVVTIIIEPNPVADAGDEKFLDCVTTVATIGSSNSSTGSEFTYAWTNASGDNLGSTATIEVTDGGMYELVVTNTTTGCMSTDQVTVNVSDELPEMVINAIDITCFGENDGQLQISNQSGGDGNYSYSLNGGDVTTDPNSFNSLPQGDYTISIMDGSGCEQSYSFIISEPEEVTVEIAGPEIVKGQVGEEITLTIDPVGSTVDSISWSDFNDPEKLYCNGGPDDCTSISITPPDNTTSIYVEVFDENGCKAFDQVQIQLVQIVDVEFPNVISPNGDGKNDIFFVNSKDVDKILSLKVFDRWGEKIYEGYDLDPRVENADNGWNGKFENKPVVPGVYVFYSEVLFIDGTRKEFSGDITVLESE